ncbi:MAG: hypothetical protein O2894_11700, partial [Planctomycetota bacterium]|nr:hypothetical protein [Planctomycetota bacterium]
LAAGAQALGRLAQLAAVEPLLELAGAAEARPLARAMAVVALGRLLEPAERPALLRLTLGACYPARSRALEEVFTIL